MKKTSHWPISILSTLSSFVNMLMPLVLVRILTPDEIGTFKIFFLYAMIFPTLSFTPGLLNGLSFWAGRERERTTAIQISSVMVLAASLVFLVAGLGFRTPLSRAFEWPVLHVTIFAGAMFGAIASSFYEEAAIATGRIWSGALFNSGFELVRTAAIIVAAWMTRSLPAIFMAHVGIQMLKTVIGYAQGYRSSLVGLAWDREIFRAVSRYAFPVSLSAAFSVFVNFSDQIILSTFIPKDAFAFYAIGCLSVPPLTLLEVSVARVLIPQMSKAFAESGKARSPAAASLYKDAVGELGFLFIPAVAGMIVFAQPIIELLFTRTYSSAAGYLRIYALTYLPMMIPYDSVARARGQAKWILSNYVIFSIFSLVVCYVLTRAFGVYGALAGVLIGRGSLRLYSLRFNSVSTGWKVTEFIPFRALAISAGISTFLGVLCLAVQPFFRSGLSWFLVAGGAFTVAYFALWFLVHKRERRKHGSRHVVMLTQYIGIGGLERMILNLSDQLQSARLWKPSVFVFDHPPDITSELHLLPSFESRKIEVETFSKARGFSRKAVFAIAHHCRERHAEVLHTHDLGALIYGVFAKWLLLGQVRLVHTQHSFVHLNRKARYVLYERFFTFFADELCVVSPDTKATYVSLGIPERKVTVVPNGVDFPERAPAPRSERSKRRAQLALESSRPSKEIASLSDKTWILYLARLHSRKGQEHAIALWEKLSPQTRSNLVLAFVGAETERGQLAKLEELIARAPDRAHIHYFGSTQTPRDWLDTADIYLSCSEFEGMPLGPIEAAGAGLPIVLSDIPGHSSLANLAVRFPLDQPERGARAIEDCWARITRDPDGESKRCWEQSQHLRNDLSLKAMSERYRALYRRGEP